MKRWFDPPCRMCATKPHGISVCSAHQYPEEAPPVPADEEEETERDLTARMTAAEFTALVNADKSP